jgi:hypothetical protein
LRRHVEKTSHGPELAVLHGGKQYHFLGDAGQGNSKACRRFPSLADLLPSIVLWINKNGEPATAPHEFVFRLALLL